MPRRKGNFDEAFPEIDDLTVEVEESGRGVDSENRKSIYQKESFPGEFIDCRNPLCNKGGFSIGSILRDVVRSKQSQLETTERCHGYVGSPKGRVIDKFCMNHFKIKISIKYKKRIVKDE